jgi:hypothetical protein
LGYFPRFSARRATRKWPYSGIGVVAPAMVTVAVLVALAWLTAVPPAEARARPGGHAELASQTGARQQGGVATTQVPIPQSRPPEAPQRKQAADGKTVPAVSSKDSGQDSSREPGRGEADKDKAGKDEAAAPAAPPPPSACRVALTDELAVAPSVPAIHGPGACGGDDLVRLEAVVLPDKRKVALTPAATMRCTMATAVVNWIRSDVAPEVAKLGSEITALDNFDSYECRGRNGVVGAPLSEHGHANAIDVHGFKLADGRMIVLTDRTQPRDFRESVLHSACTRFPTVLGPDSDWHHEDHIHIDLIERRSNYRICQWDVLDPMPKVAPLMPEVRPDDAPTRETAAADEGDKKGAIEPKASSPAAKAAPTTAGKDATPAAVPSDAGKPQAAPPGKAAIDGVAQDHPANDKPSPNKAKQDNGSNDKAPPVPLPPLKSSPAGSAKEQVSTDKTVSGKASTAKAEKASADTASKDGGSKEIAPKTRAATETASSRKTAAHKPAPRRRHHRQGVWNPFGAFF